MDYTQEESAEDYFNIITQNTQKLGEEIAVIRETKAYWDDQIASCADSNIGELITMVKSYAVRHCNETATIIGDLGVYLSCLLSFQASRVQNITLRLSSIQSKMISHEQKIASNYAREITFLRSHIPRRLKLQKIQDPILPPGFDGKTVVVFDHHQLNLDQLSSASADDDWLPLPSARDHSYSVAPTLQRSNIVLSKGKDDWRSKVKQVDPLAGQTTKHGADMSFFRQKATGSNAQSYVPTTPSGAHHMTFSAPTVDFTKTAEVTPVDDPTKKLQVVKLSNIKTTATPVKPTGPPTAPMAPGAPQSAPQPPQEHYEPERRDSSFNPMAIAPPPGGFGPPPSAPIAPPAAPAAPLAPPTPTERLPPPAARLAPPTPRSNPPPPSAPAPPPQQDHYSDDYNSGYAPPPPPNAEYEGFDQSRDHSSSNFDAFSREAPAPPPPVEAHLASFAEEPEEPQQQWDQSQYQDYSQQGYDQQQYDQTQYDQQQYDQTQYDQQQYDQTQYDQQQYDQTQYDQQQYDQQAADGTAAEEQQVDGYYDDAGNWWYRDYDGEYKMWIPDQ